MAGSDDGLSIRPCLSRADLKRVEERRPLLLLMVRRTARTDRTNRTAYLDDCTCYLDAFEVAEARSRKHGWLVKGVLGFLKGVLGFVKGVLGFVKGVLGFLSAFPGGALMPRIQGVERMRRARSTLAGHIHAHAVAAAHIIECLGRPAPQRADPHTCAHERCRRGVLPPAQEHEVTQGSGPQLECLPVNEAQVQCLPS
eukprot:jgi/Chrpa1/9021/Chrysochromulina_OHIO_Genome00017000-RA